MCHHSHRRKNVVPTEMSNADDGRKVFLFFFDFPPSVGWLVDGWAVVVCNVLISFWFHTNRCSQIRSNRRNLARVNDRLWWRQTEQKHKQSNERTCDQRNKKTIASYASTNNKMFARVRWMRENISHKKVTKKTCANEPKTQTQNFITNFIYGFSHRIRLKCVAVFVLLTAHSHTLLLSSHGLSGTNEMNMAWELETNNSNGNAPTVVKCARE